MGDESVRHHVVLHQELKAEGNLLAVALFLCVAVLIELCTSNSVALKMGIGDAAIGVDEVLVGAPRQVEDGLLGCNSVLLQFCILRKSMRQCWWMASSSATFKPVSFCSFISDFLFVFYHADKKRFGDY